MTPLVIRCARTDDRERLREIAVAAKAVWGYDLDRVREWAETGMPNPTLAAEETFVAAADGSPVGWAALLPAEDTWLLDDLWVDPAWMRRGIGSRLFAGAEAHARERGAQALEWEAEPNAVGFYEKLGASVVRESAPTAWDRVIPVMRIDFAAAARWRGVASGAGG